MGGVWTAIRGLTWGPMQMDKEANTWGMFLHLSVFASYIVPLAGLVAPIVIWQLKKDELPRMNEHGKNLMNFFISYAIYGAIAVVLCLILIGVPLLVVLGLAGVVLPIIAALKASNGEVWPYPLTIKFFT